MDDTFIQAVEHMRDMQRDYFANRSPDTLRAAKEAENKVDRMIAIANEERQGQSSLFDHA